MLKYSAIVSIYPLLTKIKIYKRALIECRKHISTDSFCDLFTRFKYNVQKRTPENVVNFLKRYKYCADNITPTKGEHTDYVWTLWLQDEVPEICQMCIQSIKNFYPNLIVLNEKTLDDYIEIPSYIKEKFENKKMLPAHYSDVIRMILLEKYGGTWIDSTCYLTQKIPKHITDSDFFILKGLGEYGLSNYFIHSNKGHYISKVIKNFLFEFWKNEDTVPNYIFFHWYIMMLLKENPVFKEEWNKILPGNISENTKVLIKLCDKKYNDDIFKYLVKSSYMHKLTYKRHQIYSLLPESFYMKLLNDYKKGIIVQLDKS